MRLSRFESNGLKEAVEGIDGAAVPHSGTMVQKDAKWGRKSISCHMCRREGCIVRPRKRNQNVAIGAGSWGQSGEGDR